VQNMMKQYIDDRVIKSIIIDTLTLLIHVIRKLMLCASIFRYAINRPFVRLNSLYHTTITCLYGLTYAPQINCMCMYVWLFI
jgi:hypothetical protein